MFQDLYENVPRIQTCVFLESTHIYAMKSRFDRKGPTKKMQILKHWHEGLRNIWDIALDIDSRPSYVASVLQEAGLIQGYYDLYNSPIHPINIYSEDFRGRLGFRDLETAERSVELIESTYQDLAELSDRAGQHHCLVTALTMYDRARFSGKVEEAEVFRRWLIKRINETQTGSNQIHQ